MWPVAISLDTAVLAKTLYILVIYSPSFLSIDYIVCPSDRSRILKNICDVYLWE